MIVPSSAPESMNIGALGGPYPRSIVCVSDNDLTFRDRGGDLPPDARSWSFGPGHDFIAPCAIGDIDQDGLAEVVADRGSLQVHPGEAGWVRGGYQPRLELRAADSRDDLERWGEWLSAEAVRADLGEPRAELTMIGPGGENPRGVGA